jgi:hypothetical protein
MDGVLEEFWCPIKYHLAKANVVVDVLSRKVKVAALQIVHTPELGTFVVEGRMVMNNVTGQPTWLRRIKEAQETNEEPQ